MHGHLTAPWSHPSKYVPYYFYRWVDCISLLIGKICGLAYSDQLHAGELHDCALQAGQTIRLIDSLEMDIPLLFWIGRV